MTIDQTKTRVCARRRIGLRNPIRRGMTGDVVADRANGDVVVAWDNGRITATPRKHLALGPDVNLRFASLIVKALIDTERRRPNGPRREGWDMAMTTLRHELVAEGLLRRSDLRLAQPKAEHDAIDRSLDRC